MKIFSILCFVFLFSCSNYRESEVQTDKVENEKKIIQPENKEQTYSTVSVNQFSMTLKNINGKCVLFYKNERKNNGQEEKNIPVDIDAPCEFIRMPGTIEPLSYTYGKKIKKQIVMVTGGKPDPTSINWDKFQPQGCGTSLQKLIIFEDQIKTGEKSENVGTYCPSAGIDEVFFAA